MRLQTFLSKAGIASRRSAACIIKSGEVCVDGKKIFEPSFKIDPEKNNILYDKKRVLLREKKYIMLHKPKGITSTRKDPFAKKTVMDCLPQSLRHLNPVGRLDKDTTGLMLLTNDGELINRLTHPRFNIKKSYMVQLDRILDDRDKVKLESGIFIDGKPTAPCKIGSGEKNKVEITLHEGRKRQIKRMFKKVGYKVVSLKRSGEGPLTLGSLPLGKWRFLAKEEVVSLKNKIFNRA